MYTLCPNCHTVFRLTTRHLAKAGGYTRCGECRQVYSALDSLFEDVSEVREALAVRQQQAEAQAATAAREADAAAQYAAEALARNEAVTATAAQPAGEATAGAVPGREIPTLKRPAANWSRSPLTLPSVFSGVAIILLLLVLAAQWVFFNRAELAAQAAWRPQLEQFCKLLHCDLPLQVDLAQLELLNRDVRQHPRVKEALLVNATLSNRADFIQPFPVLEVTFSDLGGNPVAMRRFRPIEYVYDRYVIRRGMLPGEPVPVVLEIVDPGEVAASYQFGFL